MFTSCCSLVVSVITVSESTSFLTLQLDTISYSLGKIICWIRIKDNKVCNPTRGFLFKFKVKINLIIKMSFFFIWKLGRVLIKCYIQHFSDIKKGDNLNSCRWNVIRLYYPHFTDGSLRHIAIKSYTMQRLWHRTFFFFLGSKNFQWFF